MQRSPMLRSHLHLLRSAARSSVVTSQLFAIIGALGVPTEHVAGHREGKLVLAQEHFSGACPFEERGLFLGVSARDDLDAGIDPARDSDHAARLRRVRRGDHQHARFMNMRLDEDPGFGGIAEHRRHVLARSFSTISRLSSTTTIDTPLAISASPMRPPTRP